MHAPRSLHLEAVYWILCHLKRCPRQGIYFSSHGHLDIATFADADWVGSLADMRSITSLLILCFLLRVLLLRLFWAPLSITSCSLKREAISLSFKLRRWSILWGKALSWGGMRLRRTGLFSGNHFGVVETGSSILSIYFSHFSVCVFRFHQW